MTQYFTGGVFQPPDRLRLSTPSSGKFTGTLTTTLPINALTVAFKIPPRTDIPPNIPSRLAMSDNFTDSVSEWNPVYGLHD